MIIHIFLAVSIVSAAKLFLRAKRKKGLFKRGEMCYTLRLEETNHCAQ